MSTISSLSYIFESTKGAYEHPTLSKDLQLNSGLCAEFECRLWNSVDHLCEDPALGT
jgi:hypothetical protein